ncbi:hypothetical protein JTB14_031699 [Gonioctena quinquepunctata]|nr:hypothetical protein JTB14_031699 [Gonioctena quinquepunctata]
MNLGLLKKNVDMESVCRICVSDKANLKEINGTRIPKMMETIASLKVTKNDGLPHNVCISCFRMISKCFTFKRKMERSDKILRKYIKNRMKQNDILSMALTKANISRKGSKCEASDDDIPLSERLINKDDTNASWFQPDKNTIIFSNNPPPLIPIALESNTGIEVVLNLPPLIPIKPGVNIRTLENIIPREKNLEELHCKDCDEHFSDVTALDDHKQEACQGSILHCNICKKEFTERKKLIEHLKRHVRTKDHYCKLCMKAYFNASKLEVHMRTHTGERPFTCPTCNKGFNTKGGLDRHIPTHSKRKLFNCDICGRSFKILEYMEKHRKLHSGIKPFSCTICDKHYSQSEKLLLHNRTHHTNERPYLCNICGKGFVNSSRLKRHMGMHSGLKPFACQFCSKLYSDPRNLKRHQQLHLGGGFDAFKNCLCNICNKEFSHPWRLARHKKIHQGMYQCHFCSKSYSSENFLTKHMIAKHDYIVNEDSIVREDTPQDLLGDQL